MNATTNQNGAHIRFHADVEHDTEYMPGMAVVE